MPDKERLKEQKELEDTQEAALSQGEVLCIGRSTTANSSIALARYECMVRAVRSTRRAPHPKAASVAVVDNVGHLSEASLNASVRVY